MNSKFEVAFKPFTFRSGIEIKNRIVMAPMTNTASHEMVRFQMKKLPIIMSVPVVWAW